MIYVSSVLIISYDDILTLPRNGVKDVVMLPYLFIIAIVAQIRRYKEILIYE
jgi:hypothetical protein